MRRLIASFLLLLYATANFGLSMRLDYCGDAISDISFFSVETSAMSACCAIMGPEEDCCNSEQVYLQESSDKIVLSGKASMLVPGVVMQSATPIAPILVPQTISPVFPVSSKAPPLKQRSQVRYSCFLI